MSVFKSRFATVLTAAVVLVVFSSLSAVGGSLITSKKIKDNTIRSADIRNGTIAKRDLRPSVRAGLERPVSAAPPGPPAAVRYAGPNWSIIDRNVEGGGDSYLRSGPTEGAEAPPEGIGSLGIRTGSGTDKTAFGNEVDFVGHALSGISKVSYGVFVTGEDLQASPYNAPSVTFEINPNRDGAGSYSSLVFATDKAAANKWTTIDATDPDQGFWFLTGAAGTETGCTQSGTPCSWADIQQKLPDATLYTVAITKGKDYAFSGAADALTINSTTYDFEPFGVTSD